MKDILLKRGSCAANNNYLGNAGELTLDTDHNQLRIHDGVKIGGFDLTPKAFVIDTYNDGNYWYRLWIDGFIEQGSQTSYSTTGIQTITLIKSFKTNNYIVQVNGISGLWNTSVDHAIVPTVESYAGVVEDHRTSSYFKILRLKQTEPYNRMHAVIEDWSKYSISLNI